MKRVGSLLELPASAMPASVEGLRDYTREMCDTLRVSDEARDIARTLFSGGPALWPLMQSMRQLTSGLLPPALRDQFGLGWGPKRAMALNGIEAASRVVLPRTPSMLRRPPWFVMP